MFATAPPTVVRALLVQGAAGGPVVLLQGAAEARALLSGRVAVVGGGAASPRRLRCTAGGGNQPAADDDKAKAFAEILQEVSHGVVVQGDEELLRRLATTAKEAGVLLATMIEQAASPFPDHVRQDLVLVSAAFTEVVGHCELGYATESSVVAATRGMKKMAEVFLGSGAAEALGPYPNIVYIGGKEANNESKAAYIRKLATAFDVLVRDVNDAYLRRD